MPTVPQAHREVSPNVARNTYINANMNRDVFGENVSAAYNNLGKSMSELGDAAVELKNRIDSTRMVEINNKHNEWMQQNFYDKDTGYQYVLGKDAYGKSEEYIKNYDKYMSDLVKEAKLSPFNQQRLRESMVRWKGQVNELFSGHDFKQGVVWSKQEAAVGLENQKNNAINMRNIEGGYEKAIETGNQLIEWQGEIQHLDKSTIDAQKKQFKMSVNEGVLSSYLGEGSLKAKEFFEKHKEELPSDKLDNYIQSVRSNELKYQSREIANSIIATSSSYEDMMKKAESIKDVDMYDAVVSRINQFTSRKNHIEDEIQKEKLENFYNTVIQKMQNGQPLSYDDIDNDLDPKTKYSLMNFINSQGQPNTDEEVWENLYNMSVNNAQGFAKEDLNKYRGYLSESEYKQFVKRQQQIQQGISGNGSSFYSVIKDDDKKIDAALDAIGLKKGKKQAVGFSEVRALVREFEARRGRKISDSELSDIINSLGYKGNDNVQIYKRLEKGMAERTGFIRDVINDFVYYQSKHNGEMPSDEEKQKIILNRLNSKVQEKRTSAQENINRIKSNAAVLKNISNVSPKPNEQKVLTYFADNSVPAISKKLGVKLTVTSRYRADKNSHHSEGRALDISMSEHKSATKIRIFEELLSDPTVQAVGTSDIAILTHFNGTRLGQKLVDERRYDKQHGTNHINHAHLTLINYNPQTTGRIATSNKTTNNTYKF